MHPPGPGDDTDSAQQHVDGRGSSFLNSRTTLVVVGAMLWKRNVSLGLFPTIAQVDLVTLG